MSEHPHDFPGKPPGDFEFHLTKDGKRRKNQFKCPFCESAYFLYAETLATHIRTQHPTVARVQYQVVDNITSEARMEIVDIDDLESSITTHSSQGSISGLNAVFDQLQIRRADYSNASQEIICEAARHYSTAHVRSNQALEQFNSANLEVSTMEERMIQMQIEALRRYEAEKVEREDNKIVKKRK
jgi:hypothetical protein